MREISTEELAQWLEYISQWTLQHASEKNSVYHLPVDMVDIAKISKAAARLRALAEDAERLDWLISEARGNKSFLLGDGLQGDEEVALVAVSWIEDIRQAIDKAKQ